MASAHKDDRKALAKIAAGQGVGTVQSRGSMRLAARRLGARALRAPGGRVAALEWSQMASSDGIGEEGGREARCARQGATAATRGVPRRAVVHLPLHGMRMGALRARVAR